jgi:hemerythrin-like domain-containing protein
MNITDALLGEHAVFYALFAHMDQSVQTAESTSQVRIQGAMLAAALAGHAHLEEDLLFKTLEPHIGSMGPLAVMRMEHDQIEGGLERLSAARELEQARELLLQIVEVARGHFAKEEQVLFPMASQALSTETLIDLGEQWAKRRAVTLA